MKQHIIGIGLHKFGRSPGVSGLEQGSVAVNKALLDAGIQWQQVECAFGGSTDAGNADTLVNKLGLTGIPFVNVANGCATGGSALKSACNAIAAGECEVALAVGFDKHDPGAFNPMPEDWGLPAWYGEAGLMLTTQFFAMKIQRYMHEYGISQNALAQVAAKNYYNGSLNSLAWRRQALSEDEILNATMVNDPLTKYMFCSPAEGGAAVIVCSEQFARQHSKKTVRIDALSLTSRHFGSFEVFSPYLPAEQAAGPTVMASKAAFESAGIAPADVDVLQLQDTESGAEIMHMAENGFCEHGEQEHLISRGETQITGRMPINTDGGCMANGEPIGASGLRQVVEVCRQLRQEAGERQVAKATVGYTHVYGAPGISAVGIFSV